jgi:hypothetical protein
MVSYDKPPRYNPYISKKYKMGEISNRSGQHTLARQKIYKKWMRSSRVVRASDCQRQSRNSPGLVPSILRHSGI